LCGIVDDPRLSLRELADLQRGCPHDVPRVAPRRHSTSRVRRRCGCGQRVGVPRPLGASPTVVAMSSEEADGPRSGSRVSSVAAARVPLAPPICTGSGEAPRWCHGVQHGIEPSGDLGADRAWAAPVGTGCDPARGRAISSISRLNGGDLCGNLLVDPHLGVANAEHQPGVDDVLLVNPRCSQRPVCPPVRSRSSATNRATGLPSASAAVAMRSASSGPDRATTSPGLRGAYGPDEDVEPCVLDGHHGPRKRVAHQSPPVISCQNSRSRPPTRY